MPEHVTIIKHHPRPAVKKKSEKEYGKVDLLYEQGGKMTANEAKLKEGPFIRDDKRFQALKSYYGEKMVRSCIFAWKTPTPTLTQTGIRVENFSDVKNVFPL